MSAAQFYALQYYELTLILEGYARRRKRELEERREESAWMVSWLLLPHTSKDAEPLTPDRLVGRKPRREKAVAFVNDEAAVKAYMAALKRKSEREKKRDGK